jgi:hypothetical protein
VIERSPAVSRLIDGYTEQLALYSSLLVLEREDAVAAGSPRGARKLLARLREKAQILESISAIDAGLAPFKAEWEQSRGASDPEAFGVLNRLLESIGRTIAETMALADEGRRGLAAAGDVVARRVTTATPARVAAYAPVAAHDTRVSVQG